MLSMFGKLCTCATFVNMVVILAESVVTGSGNLLFSVKGLVVDSLHRCRWPQRHERLDDHAATHRWLFGPGESTLFTTTAKREVVRDVRKSSLQLNASFQW